MFTVSTLSIVASHPMPAMATPPPPPHHLDSVLSFSNALPTAADDHATEDPNTTPTFFSDAGSDATDDEFEFAFASPLTGPNHAAASTTPADDLFAHGRIIPAYPLFDRHLLLHNDELTASSSTAAAASPDTYCAWTPRSAPGSPTREFPKSASTGEARRTWRIRDLVAGGGGGVRSHSDGKEKFVFLQPTTSPSKTAAAAAEQQKKQRKTKKGGNGKTAPAAGTTEMDLATAHRRFYGKQGAGGGAVPGERRQQQHQSYLPYRQGIVGFFAAAHALGRSHHPY